MNFRILHAIVFLVLISLVTPSWTAPTSERKFPPKIVLTSIVNGLESEKTFSCHGYIHGYLTLPEKAVGLHVLEGVWRMPNGAVNQHTRIPVDFAHPGRQTAYVWFQFHDESGGILNAARSEGNLESNIKDYNGEWLLEVRWNEITLLKTNFNVKC